MKPQLERIEVQAGLSDNHDLSIENAALGSLRKHHLDNFGEIAIQRFIVAALDQNLIAVAKDQGSKSIPFGLVDPVAFDGQFLDSLGEHRQDRRIYWEVHVTFSPAR